MHWLLAKAHDTDPEWSEELAEEKDRDFFDQAIKEAGMMDIPVRQLRAYSVTRKRPDVIKDNAITIKTAFAS